MAYPIFINLFKLYSLLVIPRKGTVVNRTCSVLNGGFLALRSIFLFKKRYTAVPMITFYQNRKCKTFLFPIFCGNFFTYFEKYQPATEPAITRCCAATTNWVIQSRPNIWYLYIYIRGESKKMARTKIHETFSQKICIYLYRRLYFTIYNFSLSI